MTASTRPLRVAILHDYLTQYGGAEKVLEEICALWPTADLFTTFYDREKLARIGFRAPHSIRALLPDRLPHHGRPAKLWTFVYPLVWRALDLDPYDLVISSTSFAAHHARIGPKAVHVSYCHTPARFLYGLTTELNHPRIQKLFPPIRLLYAALRRLDQAAARRVTCFVANSAEVRGRIARAYGRTATVIHPPVETDQFAGATPTTGEYFFTWGRLVASKRVDLLIRAAALARVRLLVAGSGPELGRLRRLAGPNVEFVGRVSDQRRLALLAGCGAVLFAAEEDFGIVPVEAMAAGKPIIAYGAGGALETVLPGETGEFFRPQTPRALADLLLGWDSGHYLPERCRARAAAFDSSHFRREMRAVVENCLAGAIASQPVIG